MSCGKVNIRRGGHKSFNVTLQTKPCDCDTPIPFDLSSMDGASASFKNEDGTVLVLTDAASSISVVSAVRGILSIELTEAQTEALEVADDGDMDIRIDVGGEVTIWSFEDVILVKDPLVEEDE